MAGIIERIGSAFAPDEQKKASVGYVVPSTSFLPPSFRRWSTEKAVREGYDASPWVKACVDRISGPASSVPWKVSIFKDKEEKRAFEWELKSADPFERQAMLRLAHQDVGTKNHVLEPVPHHPIEQLMEEPNPFFDRQGMIERLIQYLLLGGNGIMLKVRAKPTGPPLELWVVTPDSVHPNLNDRGILTGYELDLGKGNHETWSYRDVIHLMLPDPVNPWWGTSVLKAAGTAVDTDHEAMKWQKQSLENRATPDGVFMMKESIRPDEFEEMRRQVRVQYQGQENARTPLLIGNGAQYHQLSLSPVEMDFINSRRMYREEIASVFGVSLAVLGLEKTAGTALKEAKRDHWVSLIIPFLNRMQSVLNRQLAKEFGPEVFIWYDTSNVEALQENFHDKVKSAALLGRMGWSGVALNRRLNLGFTAEECVGLEYGLIPASTRSVKEIIDGVNQPEIGDGNGAPQSLPDGGEDIEDTEQQPGPDELDPAGEDTNKTWSVEESKNEMDIMGLTSSPEPIAIGGFYIYPIAEEEKALAAMVPIHHAGVSLREDERGQAWIGWPALDEG